MNIFVFHSSLVVQPTIIILSEFWFNNDYVEQINGHNGFHSNSNLCNLKAYSLDLVDRNDEHIEVRGVTVELCGENNTNIFGINRPPAGNLSGFDTFISQNILNQFP